MSPHSQKAVLTCIFTLIKSSESFSAQVERSGLHHVQLSVRRFKNHEVVQTIPNHLSAATVAAVAALLSATSSCFRGEGQ